MQEEPRRAETLNYDPGLESFLSKDPIGFRGGLNLYSYVGSNPINWVDPPGLWKDPGHSALTGYAMRTSGAFNAGDIAIVVRANLNVDRRSNWFNDPDHYMPGTQVAVEVVINSFLHSAIALEELGYHNAAMDALGRGLHTVQDRYAHFDQNAGWVDHTLLLAQCDDPTLRPQEFEHARMASRMYIDRFLRAIGRR
jgi:hypothetical protein